ncbi:hypothetical protein O6H91_02G101900 [Diphasiastrum complanatum]|uniref:Uncharacterized protein n=1 Tax=Diphasiastrum complanatum TaxID=34168 RepID=A0ACC2EIS8_DIPCM|nr:hypothetical protein O6H91_02G101900 [Diphasiastrum complanatum]
MQLQCGYWWQQGTRFLVIKITLHQNPKRDFSNLFNHAVTSNLKNCKNLKAVRVDAKSKRSEHIVHKTYIINLITGACGEIRDVELRTQHMNIVMEDGSAKGNVLWFGN